MSNAHELTSANFDDTIGQGVTLVDFWAEWCGPCRMMEPAINELAAEVEGKAKVGKLNVDNEGDLAQKYEVASIPTFIVFKDGEIHERFVGVTSKADLAKAIDAANGA
jgi:thioredoxin 1